jgi:cytochrome oxidase Cu insertion factor (SCO1/SenC/PrrC family)
LTTAVRSTWLVSVGLIFAAVLGLIPTPSRGASAAGDGRLYALPAAGSYELPVIDRVSRHELLSEVGERVPVLDLEPAQCAVVSFVYASCPDAGGCPLVLASLRRIDHALAERRDLVNRVQLVTVSFDPVRDTPEQLKLLRNHLAPRGEWRFLTAESDAQLRPVLDDFGQDALRLVAAEDGRSLGVIRHIAKVFLVDSKLGIRNIYSTGFLDYEILLRDIETLLLEDRVSPSPN